jgi:hypothetical protein
VLENLYQGYYLEGVLNATYPWIAITFEVGELYRSPCDLLPATWKAVFRILSDKRRLGLAEASTDDYKALGRPPRDYYSGDQRNWQDKTRQALGGFPGDEHKLNGLFGIRSMCFLGDGTGPHGHRLFFVKNLLLKNLNYTVREMGRLDDGMVLH